MSKIKVFPYKPEAVMSLTTSKEGYLFGPNDVDFDAEPKIYECLGFVMGSIKRYYKKKNYLPGAYHMGSWTSTESEDIPVLKALINDMGVHEIEGWRIRVIEP